MATIVTVHGTYAHIEIAGTEPSASTPQWWQNGSDFEHAARALLSGNDAGTINFIPFRWSGDNSEVERRKAGDRLLKVLRGLDADGETYAVIGHSHGGSVITDALVESIAYGQPLTGLKKWITVGTPFIEMKREPLLFTRLNLIERVLFVASLMLIMMFAFFAVAELWSFASTGYFVRPERFVFTAIMMSLPFIVFYSVLRYRDRRNLFLYSAKWISRARETYGPLWLPLCHENDEAVQGLKFLPRLSLDIVDRDFAVPAISMSAVLFLPIAYLLLLSSPTAMVSLTDYLKNNVYEVERYDQMRTTDVQELERLRTSLRQARDNAEKNQFDPGAAEEARQRTRALRQQLRELRNRITEANPEFADYESAQRFKRRFLLENGVPCEGGTLCGQGKDLRYNARLIFHVVTDELASAVVSDEGTFGLWRGILRMLVPIVLVPLLAAGAALFVLGIISFLAKHVSALASIWLNRITLAEVKRTAFGNDTEGEIALGADRHPRWIQSKLTYLPPDLGDLIANYTNHITSDTLARFRKAITTLAFAEGEMKAGMLSTYFTWKELIHATYFEVPEFRKLVLHALSQTDAFEAKSAFLSDPDYARTGAWLTAMENDNQPT